MDATIEAGESERLRELVTQQAEALSYVILAEILDRKERRPVGRLDVAGLDLGPPDARGERLGSAVLDWVRERLIEDRPVGLGTRYMLRSYAAGGRYLKSQSFVVGRQVVKSARRSARNRADPVAELPATIIAVPLDPDSIPEARVWRALGAAFEQFLGTSTQAMGGVVDAQHRMIEQQADQLARSRSLVGALVEQLVAERLERAEEKAQQRMEERRARSRAELLAAVVGELARVVEALPGQHVLTAEQVEGLALLDAVPEFGVALRDPVVCERLREPEARAELVRVLVAVARQETDRG